MRFSQQVILAVSLALALSGCVSDRASNSEAPLKSQLDQPGVCKKLDDEFEVLYIGNSITRHGFNEATIKNLGWGHVSGMAASSAGTDFVALLDKKLEAFLNRRVVACYHDYGGAGKISDRLAAMDQVKGFRPDLVVIQLGEHEKDSDTLDRIGRDYRELLQASKAFPGSPSVIAVGSWCGECAKPREHKLWLVKLEEVMARVAAEEGVPFSSVFDIAARPDASGTGTSEGVRWHPNDVGHALYADRFFQLYLSTLSGK